MTGLSDIEEWRRKLNPLPVVLIRSDRQCSNAEGAPKSRHHTEYAANAAINAAKRRPGYVDKPGRPLHAYKCGLCDYWHIGRTPDPKKVRQRAEKRQPEQPGPAAGPARDQGGQQQPAEQQAPAAPAPVQAGEE